MNTENEKFLIYLSPQDKKKFGILTARAVEITEGDCGKVFDFCRNEKVEFLIARCQTTNIRVVQALEKEGAFLVDTLVLYLRNLIKTPIPEVTGKYTIREIRDGEEEAVRTVAREAFQDYGGHYQADDRLARVGSGEIYSSWAYNAAQNRDRDHGVIVAEKGGKIIGFILVRMNNPAEGEGTLEGVSPQEGKRSLVQRDMAISAKNWARG